MSKSKFEEISMFESHSWSRSYSKRQKLAFKLSKESKIIYMK